MKYILLILVMFLIIILIFGCSEEKTYEIIIYKSYINYEIYEHFNKEGKLDLTYLGADKIYYAKEIISYTDNSVRFIDEQNKETFITADKIEVRLMK